MLLPEILPEPYQRPYTLVVDLDGTLVQSKWTVNWGGWRAGRGGGAPRAC